MAIPLSALNAMDEASFTEALGWVFEHAPWVARQAWHGRPFASLAALHGAMLQAVASAPPDDQLALIRAHPDLGTRAQVAPASHQEQAGAGLDRLSDEEHQHLLSLNQAYTSRFGFPFIMAVKGQGKDAILATLEQRLYGSYETEFQRALHEIGRIAWFRLEGAVRGMKMNRQSDHFYGKGDVRVYRTGVASRTADLFAVNLELIVRGEAFLPAYTEGDNANLVATDSMKNFIQRHAAQYEGATLEGFLHFIGERLLERYPHMASVSLTGREIPFAPISDVVLKRCGGEVATASVDLAQSTGVVDLTSGILDLHLLKLRGSSFAGFLRDEYTTLPEADDRPLFTHMNIRWRYARSADALGGDPTRYLPADQVRDLAQTVFQECESRSIQELVYQIGERLLHRFGQLSEVRLDAENHTWESVAESGAVKVYTDPPPPYGIIHLTLRAEG